MAQLATVQKDGSRNKYNLPINHRLKMARIRMEMSAQGVVNALAKQGIEVGHSSLQGYEANEKSHNHRYPSTSTLYDLAKFYGVSMDYLFGLSDKFEPESDRAPTSDLEQEIKYNFQLSWKNKRLSKKQRAAILASIQTILSED